MTITQYCQECRWRTPHISGECIECHPPEERPEPRDPETVDLFDRPEAA